MSQPIIRGGCFIAPTVAPKWNTDSTISENTVDALAKGTDTKDFWNRTDSAKNHPELLSRYWSTISLPGITSEKDDDNLMDTGSDNEEEGAVKYDAHGIALPDSTTVSENKKKKATERRENIKNLFVKKRSLIEKNFCPLGIVNGTGLAFKFQLPDNQAVCEYLKEKLKDVSVIMKFGINKYRNQAEQLTVISNILPCPVHVSPLFLALTRDSSEIYRFTDAIESLMRLYVLRFMLLELDTSEPEYKAMCRRYEKTLERYVSDQFYAELDNIVKEGDKPPAEREEKDARKFFDGLLRRFANASDAYSLARIHIVEWMICDMLHVSYSIRPALMTPDMLPAADCLREGQLFSVLRANLCNYVRDRNGIYCGMPLCDKDGNIYGTDKTRIDPKAWRPMNLEDPPLERRLDLLARWSKDIPQEKAQKYVFGLHNDWIDLHTLKEYMLMLSVDKRGKRKAMAPVLTEEEEEELKRREKQQEKGGGDDEGVQNMHVE